MKKIVIATITILLLILLFAPYLNGLVMERLIYRAEADANERYRETGSGVAVEIVDYNRHFRSSEIVWKIKFGSLHALYGIEEIILVDHARHGFAGIVSNTSLERNPWFSELVSKRLNGRTPLRITTEFSLDSEIESTVEIDAFSFPLDGVEIQVRPGILTLDGEDRLTSLESELSWGGLTAGERFLIEGVELEYDLEQITPYIWDGEVTWSVATLSGEDPQARRYSLENLSGSYYLDYQETVLSTGAGLAFKVLNSPERTVRNGQFRLQVDDLDAPGYDTFMRQYTQAVQGIFGDLAAARQQQEALEPILENRMTSVGFQLIAAYEALLKAGLQVKIPELRAQLEAGAIDGSLLLQLRENLSFTRLAAVISQPELLFDVLAFESTLSFPAALVTDGSMLTSPLLPGMRTGLFVREGSVYRHRAETRDGILLLNGQEVSLGKLR